MSVRSPHENIAARMGRWSASHRKLAIFGWLAFVLAAIVIGTAVGQKTIDQQNNNVGQAHRADQILKQAGFTESGPLTEFVRDPEPQAHDPRPRVPGGGRRRGERGLAVPALSSTTSAPRWPRPTAIRSPATGTPRSSSGT